MPRYFFHSADGGRERDLQGTELPDDAAAQLSAVRYAGEVLRWEPQEIWKRGQWRVEVTDENDALLFTVITLAIDAPRRPVGKEQCAAND